MTGKLFIIATPIGNLGDITHRAIKTLKEVDLILAEDTRVTKKLLDRYQITTKLTSYHHHSSEPRKLEILNLVLNRMDIALVTDAGTPGVADPGNELIQFLLEKEPKIQIIPVPGPSSVTATLSVSGMNTSKFTFLGFLPKKGKTKVFTQIKETKIPIVFFESPYRIKKTLDQLSEHLTDKRKVVIARELTKIHETIYRGTLPEVLKQMGEGKVKGEIVVVVDKASTPDRSRTCI